jgi:HAD superfamily hydrolase (TIGR01549 family)
VSSPAEGWARDRIAQERLPPDLRWIAFDLDDTLHYFTRASTRASEAVFCDIERQFGIAVDDLDESYREILRAAQSGHFSQSKTSREYRAERFGALLGRFAQGPGTQLDRLLDVYDTALGEALELKPGARQVLMAAKRAGLSVMVISEGPHDAQEATIERLGIAPSIDLLVTSANEGASKSDGLFEKALERAGCEQHEVLYVGDSIERDIAPTSALGMANVYVGDDALPDDFAAMRLDLAALGQLLDQLAEVDEPIRLARYDPTWPARFEDERAAISEEIGPWIAGGIHHVGSTAVPGLAAKPIIDILAGVRDLRESRACFEPLAQLGYAYAPYLPSEMHWFCKPHPSRRTHHLHLVPVGSKRYADELAFRDRLRDDPVIAAEYLVLKHGLASRFAHDREAYTNAKSDFIRRVLEQGRQCSG